MRSTRLLNSRGDAQLAVTVAGTIAVAKDLPGNLVQALGRATEGNQLAVGDDDFRGGLGEIDGAGPLRRKVADARRQPQSDLTVRQRYGMDFQRRANIVENYAPFDVTDTERVVVKVAHLALWHPRGDGQDRLAAVEHERENPAGALHRGLPLVGDDAPRRAHRAAPDDDATATLDAVLVDAFGLLRMDDDLDVSWSLGNGVGG